MPVRSVLEFVESSFIAQDEQKKGSFERSEPCFLKPDDKGNLSEDQIHNFSRTITPLQAIRAVYGFRWPSRYTRERDGKTVVETTSAYSNLFGQVKIVGFGGYNDTTFDPAKLDIEFSPHESKELLKMAELWKQFYLPALRKYDMKNIEEGKYFATKFATMQGSRIAKLRSYKGFTGWGPGTAYKVSDPDSYSTVVIENGKLRGWDFKKQTVDQSGIKKVEDREFENGLLQYYAMTDANGNLRFPPFLTSFILTAQRTKKKDEDYAVYKPTPQDNPLFKELALPPSFRVVYSALEDIYKFPQVVYPTAEEVEALASYRKKCSTLTYEEAIKVPKPSFRDYPNEKGEIVLVSLFGDKSPVIPLAQVAPDVFTPNVIKSLIEGYVYWAKMPSMGMVFRDHYHFESKYGWIEVSPEQVKATMTEKKDNSVLIKVNDNLEPSTSGASTVEVVFYEGRYNARPFDPAQEKPKSVDEHLLGEKWQEIEKAARQAGFPIYGDPKQEKDPWAFLYENNPTHEASQPKVGVVPGYENYQAPSEPKSNLFKSI